MKHLKLFAATLALFGTGMITSCSSHDEPGSGNNQNAVNGDKYLRVQINNPGSTGTRDGDEEYDAGTDSERAITSIAFYFFHDDGTPFMMENNNVTGTVVASSNLVRPSYDLTENNNTGELATTLVLGKLDPNDGWKGMVPRKMVAIANIALNNRDNAYKDLSNLSLDELKEKYLSTKGNISDNMAPGWFTMSTSSYYDATHNRTVFWTEITDDNIKTNPEDAMDNPVTVCLERLTAKVKVTLNGEQEGKNVFKVATRPVSTEAGATVTDQDIYARILGWDLNATASRSYVLKQVSAINDAYTSLDQWNFPGLNRCFWATTVSSATLSKAFKWENLKNPFTFTDYCYENTRQPIVEKGHIAGTNATKILLKAQIEDKDGNAMSVISWNGTLYPLDYFKQIVASYAAGEGQTGDPDKVEFSRGENENPMYIVTVYYDGEVVEWFDNVRYWEDGICYYVVNIPHTKKNGKNIYGVVRNHSYVITINSIVGLGTPGGPGDHPDGPENPDPETESYVSATVQVLPWHIVNFTVDVES